MEIVQDLRWWASGGYSTGFEVGRRWRQRVWDGRLAVETGGLAAWWELVFFVDFGAPQQLISNS